MLHQQEKTNRLDVSEEAGSYARKAKRIYVDIQKYLIATYRTLFLA